MTATEIILIACGYGAAARLAKEAVVFAVALWIR